MMVVSNLHVIAVYYLHNLQIRHFLNAEILFLYIDHENKGTDTKITVIGYHLAKS